MKHATISSGGRRRRVNADTLDHIHRASKLHSDATNADQIPVGRVLVEIEGEDPVVPGRAGHVQQQVVEGHLLPPHHDLALVADEPDRLVIDGDPQLLGPDLQLGEFRGAAACAVGELRVVDALRLVAVPQLGGALARFGETDTPAGNRNAAYVLNVSAAWEDPTQTDEQIAWARGCWSDMQQFSTGGVNVNFLTGEEGDERVRAAYGAANYKRLVEIKNKYDPQNVFRLNQNIKPTA